jgi:hypothetical protein
MKQELPSPALLLWSKGKFMRRVLIMALVGAAAAATPVLPAQAAPTLVGTFSGNQCTGGGITTCYATGTAAGTGMLTQVGPKGTPVVGGSPGILALDNTGTTTGFTDSLSTDLMTGDTILNYTYSGSEMATYFGIFQGGSAVGCSGQGCFNNTYLLFYDPAGFTSGSFDLSALFNNAGVSHVELFDHGGAVPEPASWALMLLGFGGVGMAMRRSRKANGRLLQIA